MVGRTILHYRIVGLLGSGGMGVVYEAQDLKLDRLVALKFLPAELAADVPSLERFQREARAASALNHPGICTIYAFEQASTDEGLRHFLVMERLEGQSLDRLLAGHPLAIDVALELGIQVADALDAAHTRGIIHRDIKPANIFVQPRNRAKVLDFGLAKVAAARLGMSETKTVEPGELLTSPGTTLGTVAYMSPEQARGEELDARTDLFSFGAVLYEMCTGRVPFGGKTSAVIFQKILDKTPEPPRALNAAVPPRLDEIILKALEKDRELRCQTAAELRADLRRLQRDTTSGRVAAPTETARDTDVVSSAPIPSAPISSGAVLIAEASRHKLALGAAAVVLLALLLAAGFGTYRWLTGRDTSDAPSQTMTMTRLTSSGAVTGCTSVSPDGRTVVYCERDRETGSVTMRAHQVATGATIKLADGGGLTTFSPDGNFVYLRRADPKTRSALFVLPAFGGGEEPRRVLTDIEGAATLSPDGERIAFVRGFVVPGSRPQLQVVVANRDGSDQRVLHSGQVGDFWAWPSSLAWSPDGRVIAAAYRNRDDGLFMSPVLIDVATGRIERLTDERWSLVSATRWLHDGSGLVISATREVEAPLQLWLVGHPGGRVKRITNDLHSYAGVNFDVDGNDTIVARQIATTASAWISDAKGGSLIRLTSGSAYHRVLGWAADGSIVYLADAPARSLWTVSPDGGAMRRLPVDLAGMADISMAPGQNWIAYHTDPVPNVWRVNLDGTGRRQLTHTGYDRTPRVSHDGSFVFYDHWGGGTPSAWNVPSAGGPATRLMERAGFARPSPDGQRFWALLLGDSRQEGLERATLGIFRSPDRIQERTIDTTGISNLIQSQQARWSPDGNAIVHVRGALGVSNLWALPLDGGEPVQLTNFESETIFSYAFSPDGKRLAMSRGRTTGDIVLIRSYR